MAHLWVGHEIKRLQTRLKSVRRIKLMGCGSKGKGMKKGKKSGKGS
jgi:hypothetical protein